MKRNTKIFGALLLCCALAFTACAGCVNNQSAGDQPAVVVPAVPEVRDAPTPVATPIANTTDITEEEPEDEVEPIIGEWSCIVEKTGPTTVGISLTLMIDDDSGNGRLLFYQSKTDKRDQVMDTTSFIWTPVGTSKSGVQTYLVTTPTENLQFSVNPDGLTGELKGFTLDGTIQTFMFDKYLGEHWSPQSDSP